MLPFIFLPHLLNLSVAYQHGVFIIPHALGVLPDDPLQFGTAFSDPESFVYFLLPLSDIKPGLSMPNNVFCLIQERVLEEPGGDGPGAQSGHLRPEGMRTVAPDKSDGLASLQPQSLHPQAEGLDVIIIILPGVGQPDAKFLLPHGHFPGSIAAAFLQPDLGNGHIFGNLYRGLPARLPGLCFHHLQSPPGNIRYLLPHRGRRE